MPTYLTLEPALLVTGLNNLDQEKNILQGELLFRELTESPDSLGASCTLISIWGETTRRKTHSMHLALIIDTVSPFWLLLFLDK